MNHCRYPDESTVSNSDPIRYSLCLSAPFIPMYQSHDIVILVFGSRFDSTIWWRQSTRSSNYDDAIQALQSGLSYHSGPRLDATTTLPRAAILRWARPLQILVYLSYPLLVCDHIDCSPLNEGIKVSYLIFWMFYGEGLLHHHHDMVFLDIWISIRFCYGQSCGRAHSMGIQCPIFRSVSSEMTERAQCISIQCAIFQSGSPPQQPLSTTTTTTMTTWGFWDKWWMMSRWPPSPAATRCLDDINGNYDDLNGSPLILMIFIKNELVCVRCTRCSSTPRPSPAPRTPSNDGHTSGIIPSPPPHSRTLRPLDLKHALEILDDSAMLPWPHVFEPKVHE